jgi:cobalt-zinc-cadmium efflux system membrane fusion protein
MRNHTSNVTLAVTATALLALAVLSAACGHKEGGVAEVKAEESGAKKKPAEHHEAIPDTVTLTANAIQEAAIKTWMIALVPLSSGLTLNGSVGYDENHLLVLAPSVGGRVVQLTVDLGQLVVKGQPVAWIASLELGRMRQEYVRALTELNIAQKGFERAKLLVAAKAISEGEFQQREGDYLGKRAAVSAAEATLRQAGDDLTDARQQNAATLPRVALRAPFDGRVVDRKVTPGTLVEALHPIMTIADLSAVWCFFQAYDKDLAVIRAGQAIAVTSEAFPQEHYTGTIDFIGSDVDAATRTVRVRATVRNRGQQLRPGLFVTGRVEVPRMARGGNVLAVPTAALQTLEGRSTVFVRLDSTRFTRRFVETGQTFDDYVQVLNGVRAGDLVVVDGSFVLKSEFSKAALAEGD